MFILPPAPDPYCQHDFSWTDDLFTYGELSKIVSIGESRQFEEALITGDADTDKKRKSKVSWIERTQESDFIYNKLAIAASKMNAQSYQFDLFGFVEPLQYTVYDEKDSHYTWHIDMNNPNFPPRKLSMVLLLSDPELYDGGDLQLFNQTEPVSLERKKGRLFVFPSYTMHRVTPVKSGIRRSLVAWVCGNKFK